MSEYMITVDEAADRLSVHRTQLYKMIREGQVPLPRKLGRSSRYLASEFDQIVRELGAAN
jgi:excisionase family DNA binding protein